MSSPALYAVAGGARTKRLRVGAMGFVVPLHHPLRLAEEIAIVDQMLGGRFECGLVPGISPGYFTPFGIDYNFRKSPTFEFVHYLRAAYGDKQPFAFHGDNHNTDSALLGGAAGAEAASAALDDEPRSADAGILRQGGRQHRLLHQASRATRPGRATRNSSPTGRRPATAASPTSPTAPWSMSTRPTRRRSTTALFRASRAYEGLLPLGRARRDLRGPARQAEGALHRARRARRRQHRVATSSNPTSSWRTSWCSSARPRP